MRSVPVWDFHLDTYRSCVGKGNGLWKRKNILKLNKENKNL